MNFAKKADLVMTIIYTIICVLLTLLFILSVVSANSVIDNSAIDPSNYSADDVTAGYRLIGHMFTSGLTFTAGIFLFFVAIIIGIIDFPLIIITIFAYIGIALYKKSNDSKHIKRNLIVKIVYTIIWTVFSLVLTINNTFYVVFFIASALILALLFSALYNMREHEYFPDY